MYRDELSRTDTRSYLVAEDGDRVVGYAGLIAYDDEAHVATIGVAPDRQGEGIGAQLLDALLVEADRRSPVVLLEVRADNEVAQGLYRRRGFTEVGRRPRYYQPSGKDAVVMRREKLRASRWCSGSRRRATRPASAWRAGRRCCRTPGPRRWPRTSAPAARS